MATVRLWRRGLNVIDTMDMEQYLRGVVPSEMPASWPPEALKAQAVAARTYATRAIAHPRHPDRQADLCDTAQCQAYSEAHYPQTDAAVRATAGITWDNPCLYVSKCGRQDCCYCLGTGGYDGQTWTGRMCQYGAAAMAQAGASYSDILSHYYGGAAIMPGSTVYVPSVVSAGTDWSRYPKPPNDTGAGVHGGANASFPLGDNDGLIPGLLDEMRRMGFTWVKLLDRDGSSYNAARMVLQAGMMPVIRLYRTDPYPGVLTEKQREAAQALAGLGVRYFERGNEPNLSDEWQDGAWPGFGIDWPETVFRAMATDWANDASFLASLGAFVAVDAMSPGGEYRSLGGTGDDIGCLGRFLVAIKTTGALPLLKDRGWISVHNAGLNHDPLYPDDPINQASHPGQTINTHWYPNGYPTGASNCIRKPEAVHQFALEVTGLDLPVMCTEGGWWSGNADDPRYPALTYQTASERQADTLRSMQHAPAWLLAQMPWLLGNRKLANLAPNFERAAWIRWPGFGDCPADEPAELPVIAMLKAEPCQVRGAPMTLEETIGSTLQSHIIPLNPAAALQAAAQQDGLTPASPEVDIDYSGTVYRSQAFRRGDVPQTQFIYYARLGDWGNIHHFTRAN